MRSKTFKELVSEKFKVKISTPALYVVLGLENPYAGYEDTLQRECFKLVRLSYKKYQRLIFAVPNGGYRKKSEAAIFAGTGVKAGTSDVIVLVPRRNYSGMVIELKSKPGKKTNSVTYDQHEFLNAACTAGYKSVVVYNYNAFSDLLKWYFGEGE